MNKSLHVKMMQTTLQLQEIALKCYSPERFIEVVGSKLANQENTTFNSYKNTFQISHCIKVKDKTHIISANFNIKYKSKFHDELMLEGPINEDITVRQVNEAQLFMQNPHADFTFIEETAVETHRVQDTYSGKYDVNEVHIFSDGSLVVVSRGKAVYVSD